MRKICRKYLLSMYEPWDLVPSSSLYMGPGTWENSELSPLINRETWKISEFYPMHGPWDLEKFRAFPYKGFDSLYILWDLEKFWAFPPCRSSGTWNNSELSPYLSSGTWENSERGLERHVLFLCLLIHSPSLRTSDIPTISYFANSNSWSLSSLASPLALRVKDITFNFSLILLV